MSGNLEWEGIESYWCDFEYADLVIYHSHGQRAIFGYSIAWYFQKECRISENECPCKWLFCGESIARQCLSLICWFY